MGNEWRAVRAGLKGESQHQAELGFGRTNKGRKDV
jgi:hypothetical protein